MLYRKRLVVLYEYRNTYINNMQNLADMLIDSYSCFRLLFHINNVSIHIYVAMVQNSV